MSAYVDTGNVLIESACSVDKVASAMATLAPMIPGLTYHRSAIRVLLNRHQVKIMHSTHASCIVFWNFNLFGILTIICERSDRHADIALLFKWDTPFAALLGLLLSDLAYTSHAVQGNPPNVHYVSSKYGCTVQKLSDVH